MFSLARRGGYITSLRDCQRKNLIGVPIQLLALRPKSLAHQHLLDRRFGDSLQVLSHLCVGEDAHRIEVVGHSTCLFLVDSESFVGQKNGLVHQGKRLLHCCLLRVQFLLNLWIGHDSGHPHLEGWVLAGKLVKRVEGLDELVRSLKESNHFLISSREDPKSQVQLVIVILDTSYAVEVITVHLRPSYFMVKACEIG